MAMFWDHAGTLLARFLVCGPLLYIGLVMVTDPGGVVAILAAVANVTRALDRRPVARSPMDFEASSKVLVAFRVAGIAISALALLALTGLAG